MKTLKFDHQSAELISAGKKHSTWRIDDEKNLSINDRVEVIDKVNPLDKSTWVTIGVMTIEEVAEKRLYKVDLTDLDATELYNSIEEMYKVARQYYGPKVTNQTPVKIIKFSFQPYEETKPVIAEDMVKADVTEVKLFADGGSRGNPGPSAGGFVITDMEGHELAKDGRYLGITTNNQAEYRALEQGLETALQLGAKKVHVYMDSMLVVNQMKGLYKIKNLDLQPIYHAIKQLCTGFEKISFTHVPRELNKLADAMVNKILDETSKQT